MLQLTMRMLVVTLAVSTILFAKERNDIRWHRINIEIIKKHGTVKGAVWDIKEPKRIAEVQQFLRRVESRWKNSPFQLGYGVSIFVEGRDSKGERCFWLGVAKDRPYFISKQVPDTPFFYDNNKYLTLSDEEYLKLLTMLRIPMKEVRYP